MFSRVPKAWREKNNKTKKSPLSRERHQTTNALTAQERARLIEQSLINRT